MIDWPEYVKFLIGLIAIIDPFGTIPILINLSNSSKSVNLKKIASSAAITTVVVLEIALFTGDLFLRVFGISIGSFQVGGGILILLMAISMMYGTMSRAKQTEEEARHLSDRESIAIVPLGIPLLAGPGAISTVVLYAHLESSLQHYAILSTTIILIACIVWLTLRAATMIADLMGTTGINVAKRIMGLILAALGIEFITNGLKLLFPALS
jgi:multiple antibiotic resistance protein